MLPSNPLNALKAYAVEQKLQLPVADATPKMAQFEPGKRFEGSVQTQVSPGIFNVRVASQLIQMQLPSTIRNGDTVALQVISTLPRLTFSMVNSVSSTNPLATPEQLGSAARLLSALSQQAPEKAHVRAAQSAPLWDKPQPPESKQLSGLLRETLSNSGLFYESHQAQWLEGTRSTAQLLHEPQNLTPKQAREVVAGNTAGRIIVTGNSSGKAAMASEIPEKIAMTGDASGKTAMAGDAPGKASLTSDTYGKTAVANDPHGKIAMAGDASGKTAMANGLPGKIAAASDAPGKAAMAGDTSGKTAMANDLPGKIAMAGDASGKTAMANGIPGEIAMASDAVGETAMVNDSSGKIAAASNPSGKAAIASDHPEKIATASDTSGKAAMASDAYGKTAMMGDAYGKTAVMSDTANPSVAANNAANASAPNQPNTPLSQEGKALGIPDHLQPLVQQQLNALETRQMVWQGNVWPQQSMQWEVHEQASQNPGVEEQRQWVTQLRLDLPNLGEVAATLRLNSAGLSLTLNAGTPETRAMLGGASTQLASALSDAGIPVISAQVTTI